MIEKVNPSHPDKVADRIAGAIVDLAYTKNDNPKIAVEVLIGHGTCNVIIETSEKISRTEVSNIVERISGTALTNCIVVPQDKLLSENQTHAIRCGDNGIFKGCPLTTEQKRISEIARDIYNKYNSDGKYILSGSDLIICQSNAMNDDIKKDYPNAVINPLGEWTGGTDVDSGATNRKLGSDMADSVTGGGLHGKDLSKADVSVNIYAFQKAQELGHNILLYCAIGDECVDGIKYDEIVQSAREYINKIGGFEKFAEWGLF